MKLLAHEIYVLTSDQIRRGLSLTTQDPLASLTDPKYRLIFIINTVVILGLLIGTFLWSLTPTARKLAEKLKEFRKLGTLIIRAALSASFLFSAYHNCIFGPEISLISLPGGDLIRIVLVILAIMILTGVFIKTAGLVGVLLYLYVFSFYGVYTLSYASYFGVFIALFF